MKVKFEKGIDKMRPEVWSSSNLFTVVGTRDSRNKKLKLLKSKLNEHGIRCNIENFAPNNWTLKVRVVVIEPDEANEAFFLLLAADGIDI